jgi:membrane protease YdiL (CAAX protease family)
MRERPVEAPGALAYRSRMRAFLAFMAAIAGTLVLAALLAYPLYVVIHPIQPEWWFHKIASRLWQLLMLGGVVLVVWRLRLTDRRAWGYGAPRPLWLRQFAFGLAAGLVTMLPVTLSMLALDVRPLRPELDAARVLNALLAGMASGLAVGFLEETFFRGLLQGAVLRELRRPVLGIVVVSVVYSALHFLARDRIPHEQVNWLSGLALLQSVGANFAAPATIVDSILALVAVGGLLGLVTWWTGSIALAVGLHAGWVWMMRTTVGATAANEASPLAWLISDVDGYTGWLVLAWTVAITVVVVRMRHRFVAWRDPNRPRGG